MYWKRTFMGWVRTGNLRPIPAIQPKSLDGNYAVEIVIPLLRLFPAGVKIAVRDSYHWEALPYSTVIL
jgi:hypothetical protein